MKKQRNSYGANMDWRKETRISMSVHDHAYCDGACSSTFCNVMFAALDPYKRGLTGVAYPLSMAMREAGSSG